MTPEELKRAKEICEKATPGPWGLTRGYKDRLIVNMGVDGNPNSGVVTICSVNEFDGDEGYTNGLFIAESRDLLPKALAEIEKLQSDINKLLAYDSECKKILAQVDIGVVGQSLPERCREAVRIISPCDHEKNGWQRGGVFPVDAIMETMTCSKCSTVYVRRVDQ